MTRDELVKLITDALDAARRDNLDLTYGQFEEDNKQIVGVTDELPVFKASDKAKAENRKQKTEAKAGTADKKTKPDKGSGGQSK